MRDYEYLIAVAEERSLSRATRRLNISQPSVSGAIAKLEKHFGQLLFERHRGTPAVPTVFCRKLVSESRQLLGATERLEGTRANTAPVS
ncbi:MAG: LysR family transcriptional regulator [Shimia sp.]|nr:LysR family transcriptional regulator [Shimia sp.]